MKFDTADYIAGWKTATDWQAIRPRLIDDDSSAWYEAYSDYFLTRLKLRYLDPIAVLQEHLHLQGEGFSILVIQCSLIEFLESTREGTNYCHPKKGQKLGEYEYSASGEVFSRFLSKHPPFLSTFTLSSARDFYANVRCALVHEARTKSGWRIWADGPDGLVASVEDKIVFRNNFQAALLTYISDFKQELTEEASLKAAFIRKFDSLAAA
ncbi:hypothetical protein [Aquabacterium sp. OR-4]|uniref:hypothetical protein n=1 Tax=Aquabacterium sp. OR-4 TaxID=2978127 RepID=UPI0021B2E829|nr:hypothetical protein [Aquabacterium sp. OR-4]MDT7838435.1 hypothetical protein [Aquabacterium sp. OR-4]